MGTHKIYSGIQGIRDNISGSLYGDCHELLACFPQDIKSCLSITKLPLRNKNNKGKNCCILVILWLERSKITHNLLEASAVGPRVLLDRTHRPGIQYHTRPPF